MPSPSDVWEHGSEFHWPDFAPVAEAPRHPWSGRGNYFGSGRDAIRVLLDHGRRQRGWQRIWIPTYLCQEVVSAMLSTGLAGQFYPDAPDGPAPDWHELDLRRGDVLFVLNRFGLGTPPDLEHFGGCGAEILEDHTHDPWSDWAFGSTAGFALVSLRKTLPLPDGAVLWSPRGHDLPAPPPPSATHLRAAESKLSGMLMKTVYLAGHTMRKDTYRALLVAGETAIAEGPPSAMLAATAALLNVFPTEHWRETRRRNHRHLAAEIAGLPGVRVLPANGAGSCPFSVVLVFQSRERRDAVRRRLIQKRVYPAVLWPLDDVACPGLPAAHRDLSRRLLSLHCDMRYAAADLSRVAAIVARANEEADK